MKDQININRDTCTLCGLCGEVYPNRIMKGSARGRSIHLEN